MPHETDVTGSNISFYFPLGPKLTYQKKKTYNEHFPFKLY